jgi:hypothetical protein
MRPPQVIFQAGSGASAANKTAETAFDIGQLIIQAGSTTLPPRRKVVAKWVATISFASQLLSSSACEASQEKGYWPVVFFL